MPPEPAATANDKGTLPRLVQRLAQLFRHELTPGELAELRRLRPGEVSCATFWKMVATVLEPAGVLTGEGPYRDGQERRWAVLLSCFAVLEGSHARGHHLGRVLSPAEANLSELRLLRLLRGRGEALFHDLRTTVHYLATRGATVDWLDLTLLILSDDRRDRETIRRRIARDYYRMAPST